MNWTWLVSNARSIFQFFRLVQKIHEYNSKVCGCLTYKCIWLWNHAYEKIFVWTEFTCKMYCTNKRLSSPLHMCRKKNTCVAFTWNGALSLFFISSRYDLYCSLSLMSVAFNRKISYTLLACLYKMFIHVQSCKVQYICRQKKFFSTK